MLLECVAHLPLPATACRCLLLPVQELCEGDLTAFLDKVRPIMYRPDGSVLLECAAPLLLDVCTGMLYLHSRNIVHGGEWGQLYLRIPVQVQFQIQI